MDLGGSTLAQTALHQHQVEGDMIRDAFILVPIWVNYQFPACCSPKKLGESDTQCEEKK